ncbi:Uncharacterised protein [Moraxella caprae]|uniref:Uncharacterized protein n=1 Tax=Moraxella caprae TaxID=90240 RepID=A0A378QVW7_9GAMM|nr:Uncharacterised protein [Moraxella caprae]
MFIISVYSACENFDNKIYENLRQQRLELLIDKNWLEQLIHNEYSIKMTLNNWINGKRQAITAFQKLFGKLGFIFIFFSAIGFIMPYFLNKYE